jgi:hypothetical protein
MQVFHKVFAEKLNPERISASLRPVPPPEDVISIMERSPREETSPADFAQSCSELNLSFFRVYPAASLKTGRKTVWSFLLCRFPLVSFVLPTPGFPVSGTDSTCFRFPATPCGSSGMPP